MKPKREATITLRPDVQTAMATYTFLWRSRACEGDMIEPQPVQQSTPSLWTAIGTTMIRLLLVEDQPSVRKGMRMLLATEPDLSLVGEAPDGAAALDLAAALCPDIVLMDVDTPRLDEIETACALSSICPQASIIFISFQDDTRMREIAADAGAAAVVAKSMPVTALLASIRQVAHMQGAHSKGG